MSLADELLADMEGDDEDNEETINETNSASEGDDDENVMQIDQDQRIETEVNLKCDTVRDICKLRDSSRLKNVLVKIDIFIKSERKSSEMIGTVESDPEYQLICESNLLSVEIDNEISLIYKFVKEKYQKRFPELDSMIMVELDYIRAVKVLRNDLEIRNNEELQNILNPATIMIISVTVSTTQGQPLTDAELANIDEACIMALELAEFKIVIFDYVQSKMTFVSPNLCAIVGATTAAKLVAIAGGLTKLSKIPACNVLVLGAEKKTLQGFSKVQMLPHTGFIYYSDLVQQVPTDLRKKIARVVANKATLAARVDASHESIDGIIGQNFRDDIEKKIDKLLEPAPVKFIKPLPKPLDAPKKKRGGKRVRKQKERFAVTEMRKQQNRMNFGEIEDDAYQDDLGYTRGAIGKKGTGSIRSAQIDEKTKVRISKTLQKNLQRQNNVIGTTTTIRKQVSGTSSVAFTPLQGLEIHNPSAAEKMVSEANNKYFSSTSGFSSVTAKKM